MNLEEAVKMFYHVSDDYEVIIGDETQHHMSDTQDAQDSQDDDNLQDSDILNDLMAGTDNNNPDIEMR